MSTRPPPDTAFIAQTIEQQLACALSLVSALEQERLALLENRLDLLETISAQKLASATRLQALNAELDRVAADGVEKTLGQSSGAQALMSRWQELLRVARDCQRANLGNGALLEERQSKLRWAQRALAGNTGPTIYGRSGDTGAGPAGRRIASA